MCSYDGGDGGNVARCLEPEAHSVKNCEGSEVLPYLYANQ